MITLYFDFDKQHKIKVNPTPQFRLLSMLSKKILVDNSCNLVAFTVKDLCYKKTVYIDIIIEFFNVLLFVHCKCSAIFPFLHRFLYNMKNRLRVFIINVA